MMRTQLPWWIVAGLGVGVLGASIVIGLRAGSSHDQHDAAEQQARSLSASLEAHGVSDDGIERIQRILSTVVPNNASTDTDLDTPAVLSDTDAEFLAQTIESTTEVQPRRFALAAYGDILAAGTRITPAQHDRLDKLVLRALSDPDEHIRSSALATTGWGKLDTDPRFYTRLLEIRNHDSSDRLAAMAGRILDRDAAPASDDG